MGRPAVGNGIRAAALWFTNWDFAGSATQYMADVDKSPVLNYWSLSVEEQFYVIWPLLILLLLPRRRGRHSREEVRRRLLCVLAVLGVASLLVSGLTTGSTGLGLTLVAWSVLGFDRATTFPGWAAVVPVAGTRAAARHRGGGRTHPSPGC